MGAAPDNQPEKANRSLVAIAPALDEIGARAVTFYSVARIKPASSREIFNEIIRKK